ncbi:MAG: bifunctional 4-hydroxy-3-methylbut-2-enyl diphosphate reductase/30S ribosomal protein S1 [Eubacteriales bacterium]|jgi:ribosomal protein S1/(E)-4-hydroxy-3-methyl-but-2-enyl pyrophosphate reductase
MKVTVAQSAGFCFGVSRAVEMAMKLAEQSPVVTLGPLIHNREALEELECHGVRSVGSVAEIPEGTAVLLRAHGVPPEITDELAQKGIPYTDATCPFVRKIHQIVRDARAEGRTVVVIGDAVHPEVVGIRGHAGDAVVFPDVDSLNDWLGRDENAQKNLAVVAQTTTRRTNWEQCVNSLGKQCTNAKIFDTICSATDARQREAKTLAAKSEVMLVLGDPNSSNTRKLAQIARECCPRVYCIENAGQAQPFMWQGARTVGVTAGASTPAWIMKEVVNQMTEELKTAQAETVDKVEAPVTASAPTEQTPAPAEKNGEESFETLLEASIKTLNSGDRVTGTVTGITSGEVNVDLGVKQAAYIPVSELSDDPEYKVEENIRVGDEIDAFVVRVSDVEGMIMLSKKKLDSIRGWDIVQEACDNRTTMEGIVTEENKGGIVVMVKGIRVFVPASQTGLPRDTPMTGLVKQTVKLRITEVTRARRRVIGSIRAVHQEERRAKAEKLWETIDVGSEYDGVVKSLTSYGAFVDIGGVDGMVHISELSWRRIRHPSDVVKVGDSVRVFVLGFDKEKKRISLGYRRAEDNPWTKFISTFSIGDTARVKIAKFMPFGAFAEVLPGVDGLIHISQIADRRIARPEDVLQIGETVDARIIDIDMDRQKISLSIRALLEEQAEEVAVSEEAAVEETVPEEVVAEEATPEEEVAAKEAVSEEVAAEEAAPEEAVPEEAVAEETVAEETVAEEAAAEKATAEDPQ